MWDGEGLQGYNYSYKKDYTAPMRGTRKVQNMATCKKCSRVEELAEFRRKLAREFPELTFEQRKQRLFEHIDELNKRDAGRKQSQRNRNHQ